MPSIFDFAMLSSEVCSDIPRNVGRWTVTANKLNRVSGELQAAVFIKNNQSIVAFKGTTGGMGYGADHKLGFCMNSSFRRKAKTFVENNAPAGALLTGHSLGGAIAQVVGHRGNVPFVTFNAPGVALLPNFGRSRIGHNDRLSGDIISQLEIHREKIITLSGAGCIVDPSDQHSMDNLMFETAEAGKGEETFH